MKRDEVFEPTVMGGLMHVLISILLILGFIFVLLFGTMSVLHDMVARSLQQPLPQFDADGGQRQELASVGESAAAMPISQVPEG